MNQFTATFRVVTPMFLGGADPTTQAELRVPSIKGALRFWWRALMWGTVEDVAELQSKEAKLFGSRDQNVGQSKFLMRLESSTPPIVLKANEVLAQRGDKAASNRDAIVGEGARYLGYGLMGAFGANSGRLTRPCLAAPFEFTLHLRFKPKTEDRLQVEVLNALKLLGLCGGLGSRSRRGYGSVTLTSLKRDDSFVWTAPKNAEKWEHELCALLGGASSVPVVLPGWTSFCPNASKVLLLPSSQTSPHELLAKIGREFVFFRSNGRTNERTRKREVLGTPIDHMPFQEDHDLMKNPATPNGSHPSRITFGLPQNYTHPNSSVAPIEFDRRASSLFFHIHQPSSETPPLGILLFLPSRFLPEGRDKISVGGKAVPLAHGGTGDFWKPVDDFLQRFLPNGTGTENFSNARLIQL